ncbi:MAG TPA: hypothetical protein VNZ64_10935 [Candidatus Acidoferrum sp.]|jgi:hypothetical protein|nr:hypothetical protein [Candidatus Acidoferrum sp.]
MRKFPAIEQNFVLLGLLLLTGCSHLTSELGCRLPAKPANLIVGQSTLGDVLKGAGPPTRISAAAGGFTMLYEYNGIEENQIGFSFEAPVLRFIKFVGARARLEHQAWVLTFNTNGTLQAWGEEHWRNRLGAGAGAQILVTVSSLVDSSQIRRPAPQHDWGKLCLAPLPKMLNVGQSLDTGSQGLEQTLSPTAVGQRALEMTPEQPKIMKKKK